MMSLLLNKKHILIFCFVLQFIMTSYTNAEVEASFESISIDNRHEDNIYYPGDSFYTSCYIKNNGDEDISYHSFVFRIYAGDYHIGSFSVPTIKAGEVHLSHVPCTLPNDIPYDTYTILGKIFLEDSNLDNNIASDSTDIIVEEEPPPPPVIDLKVSYVAKRQSSNIFHPGGEVSFVSYIDNIGNTISDGYVVNFYFGSYLIGSVSRDSLGPDKRDQIETDIFTIPVDIPDGDYYIYGEVVCSNDSNTENNRNRTISKIKLITPYPEIAIVNIESYGDSFRQGESITVKTTIQAGGYLNATNICLEYYVNDFLISSISRSDLEPGNTDDFATQIQIPDDLPDGYYTIWATVFCTDDTDTSNNMLSTGTPFRVGKRFDLEVKAIQTTSGTYMPKDTIEVYSLVKNAGDKVSNAYTIDYYLSTDRNITAMDYRIARIERNALEPEEQHSYNTTLKLPPNLPASDYYIGVKVTCSEENNFGNNSMSDDAILKVIHPANYVCGHVSYEYQTENDQDIRYALLKIIDTGTNRLIAETYTDEYGNYGEVVLRDEASANIYIKVYAESVSGAYPGTMSKICIIRDGVNEGWFSQKSSAFPHPQNSTQIIDYRTSSRGFMVYDSMVEAFIQAKEFFGIEMDEITAYWPSTDNGTYYYPGKGIFIGRDDEWDRDIILHEYGHYIAEVYDFCQGSVGENSIHTWDMDLTEFPVERTPEHAANLAFREAWPTLFSIASQYRNSEYPRSGDTKYHDYYSYYNWSYELDLEQDTFDKGSPGEFYENMNCCALWDIFDDHVDNANGFNEEISDMNLTRTWTILRGYKPEDMHDFWVGWFHANSKDENLPGITDILDEHCMSYASSGQSPVVPQNHAPVAVAGEDITVPQDRPEGAEVHLDASGSHDADNNTLTYTWRYGYTKYVGAQIDIVLPVGESVLEVEVTDGEITRWDTIKVTVTPM